MMPTKTQLDELIYNTYHGWISINGVTGYKFISKTDDSKYIFLPAAGNYWGNDDYISNVAELGVYRSVIYYDISYAYYMSFSTKSIDTYRSGGRSYGFSICGVR